MVKKNLPLLFSLILNGLFIFIGIALLVMFGQFNTAIQKPAENRSAIEHNAVATLLSPLSLCFANIECVLELQKPLAFALYSLAADSAEAFSVCDSPADNGPRLISRVPLESFLCNPLKTEQSQAVEEQEEVNAKPFQPSTDVANPLLWKEVQSKVLNVKLKVPAGWEAKDEDDMFVLRSQAMINAQRQNAAACIKKTTEPCVTELPFVDIQISRASVSPETMTAVSMVVLPDRRLLEYREAFSIADILHYVLVQEEQPYNLEVINEDNRDNALTILSTLTTSNEKKR